MLPAKIITLEPTALPAAAERMVNLETVVKFKVRLSMDSMHRRPASMEFLGPTAREAPVVAAVVAASFRTPFVMPTRAAAAAAAGPAGWEAIRAAVEREAARRSRFSL